MVQHHERIGAFGRSAYRFCELGLSPTPTSGEDGKRPILKGYNRGLVNLGNVVAFKVKFAGANVGLVCGPSNVNILDIDEPSLADDMVKRFGDTPLKVQTAGRNGFQFYYRAHPEIRPIDLRATEGLPVEVKAGGNIAIAPPSVNFKTSREYRFVEGSLDEKTLRRLPHLNTRALLGVKSLSEHRAISQGQRNEWLFGQCLKHAHHCDDFDDLLDVARTRNSECEPELGDAEVVRVARSAWSYTERGLNFSGGKGAVILSREEIETLGRLRRGDALALVLRLRLEHSARVMRGETFALSTTALEMANTINGWSRQNYRTAIKEAISSEWLRVVRSAPGQPSQYTLPASNIDGRRGWLASNHNVTRHPLPATLTDKGRPQ